MQLTVMVGDRRVTLAVRAGRVLDQELAAAGVLLNRRCSGEGRCSGCTVIVEQGRIDADAEGGVVDVAVPRQVLACRTRLAEGPALVRVPHQALIESSEAIDDTFTPGTVTLDPAVRSVQLDVPPAALDDRRSDTERVLDAASLAARAGDAGTLQAIVAPLHALRQLDRLLDSGCRGVELVLTAEGERWSLAEVHRRGAAAPLTGVALDIGTTTVLGLLVDLQTGRMLGQASRYNRQITQGADVAARISAARTPAQLQHLQRLLVRETINPIVDELCTAQGIAAHSVRRFSVAGNTVMTHLLLGLSVAGIGALPFNPRVRALQPVPASLLGLHGHPRAQVDIAPAVAGYIGGDVVADLLAADFENCPDGSLLIDIGTNAEVVLKDGERLLCCATPAGPAFEGGGLRHGCRAAPGAITRIRADAALHFECEVIGGGRPVCVCGSAVVDFIAEGRRGGWIDAVGRFDIPRLKRCGRHATVALHGGPGHACVLAGEIMVTEADVAEILQAKAALAAGVCTLLELAGRAPERVPRVVLAGGFARRLDLVRAIAIGLLPRLPAERFQVIGNGALAAACRALLDRRSAAHLQRLHRLPQVVELNLVPAFEGHFIDNLRLPTLPAGLGASLAPAGATEAAA